MRYTLAGGTGAVDENIAWTYNSLSVDVKAALKSMEHEMMYNDANSNWGHRYNILTPLHNEIAIGVAADNNNVYLVEDFENNYVQWNTLTANGSMLNMDGSFTQTNFTIQQVEIWYDNPSNLTVQQLSNAPYNGAYDQGTFAGMVLPEGWQSDEGITITANTWNQNGQNFQINFDLTNAFNLYGKGVYTLSLQTNIASTNTQDNSFTTYSLWYAG